MMQAPRQNPTDNGLRQHQLSDGSDPRVRPELSRKANDSMSPAAQPGHGCLEPARDRHQSQARPLRGLAGPRSRRQQMRSHRAQHQGFPSTPQAPHEHLQNTGSHTHPRRDGPAPFQHPQSPHASLQDWRPYQSQPPVQQQSSHQDHMPFPSQRVRFQARPPAHAAGPASGKQHRQQFWYQPARPSVRPADRRQTSSLHAFQSTESAGARAQHIREQGLGSSVTSPESNEPAMGCLSLSDCTDGQVASSRPSTSQQGQEQAGHFRQSRQAPSRSSQSTTGLAHHTEEHLARLLADSRRATAAQHLPCTSLVPTKREGQTQSAVPYKKQEASVVGTSMTAGSSMNPAEPNDDYGTCVICAEQRQVSLLPAVLLKVVCLLWHSGGAQLAA